MIELNKIEKSFRSNFFEKLRQMANPESDTGFFEEVIDLLKNDKEAFNSSGRFSDIPELNEIRLSKSFVDLVKNLKKASNKVSVKEIQKKAYNLFGVELDLSLKSGSKVYFFDEDPNFTKLQQKDFSITEIRRLSYELNYEKIVELFFNKKDKKDFASTNLKLRFPATDMIVCSDLFKELSELLFVLMFSSNSRTFFFHKTIYLDRESLETTLNSKNSNGYTNFIVGSIIINKGLILNSYYLTIGEIKSILKEQFHKSVENYYSHYMKDLNDYDLNENTLFGNHNLINFLPEEIVDKAIYSIFKTNNIDKSTFTQMELDIIIESVKRVLKN